MCQFEVRESLLADKWKWMTEGEVLEDACKGDAVKANHMMAHAIEDKRVRAAA